MCIIVVVNTMNFSESINYFNIFLFKKKKKSHMRAILVDFGSFEKKQKKKFKVNLFYFFQVDFSA